MMVRRKKVDAEDRMKDELGEILVMDWEVVGVGSGP
jgi:hypothetical protein